MMMKSNDINDYLECTKIIDYDDHSIQKAAMDLAVTDDNDTNIIKKIFEFVRENI